MKKIDKLVLSSFIGPFILTFFIALFVLVMQFLWKYVDDMVGKGLEWYLILELLFYTSASMVPLALPLAALLSSIMSMGNMGEHFELTALKGAGISLLRTMRMLIISIIIISIGAFYFSNYAVPYSNLKFGALLYDIREHKPTLNIIEGVFNNEIDGYTIRIGDKEKDNKTIHNILIYDHTRGRGNDDLVIASHGEMYTTDDNLYLILKLYDGYQYQELQPKNQNNPTFEQSRIQFKEFEKIIDLSEFTLRRTDESFFKDHYSMLNIFQLNEAIDSIIIEREKSDSTLMKYIYTSFNYMKYGLDSSKINKSTSSIDLPPIVPEKIGRIYSRTLNAAKNVHGFIEIVLRDDHILQDQIIKHRIEYHRKFTLSVACFVLFLIGAPLGAIIRKGGLGMPLVMAVIFFVVFHVTSIIGEKFAREYIISEFEGMWFSTIILLPLGGFLIYKAMNDSTLFNVNWYIRTFSKLFVMNKNK